MTDSLPSKYPEDVLTRPPVCLDGYVNYTPAYINAAAAVTCVLSMIGSVLIVLSYVCFKWMRSTSRVILLHLSLMDFMVACANFVGSVVDFNTLLEPSVNTTTPHPSTSHEVYSILCVTQASFALYGTLGSILWTIAIAVHIYLSLMLSNSKLIARAVYCYYLVCYGIPALMTAWFVATSKLGRDPIGGSWCTVDSSSYFNVFYGSNIWVYIACILVPVLSFPLVIHMKLQLISDHQMTSRPVVQMVQSVEGKLLAIPVIFIFLRIWSLVLIELYTKVPHLPCPLIMFLLLFGNIGDSGQGFCNALIYCLFNKNVRQAYLCSYKWCRDRYRSKEKDELLTFSQEGIQ